MIGIQDSGFQRSVGVPPTTSLPTDSKRATQALQSLSPEPLQSRENFGDRNVPIHYLKPFEVNLDHIKKRSSIVSQITSPEFNEANIKIAEIKKDRFVQQLPVEVIQLSQKWSSALPPYPGTALILFGDKEDPHFSKWIQAFQTESAEIMSSVIPTLSKAFSERPVLSIKEAADEIISGPSIVDVRYGEAQLAGHLTVFKTAPYGNLVVPYTGGNLDTAKFNALEYKKDPQSNSAMRIVVVLPHEKHSEFEQSVLDQVSEEDSSVHIGHTQLCALYCVATVAAVVLATIAGTNNECKALGMDLNQVRLPDSMKAGGEISSVKDLLQRRAEIFAKYNA